MTLRKDATYNKRTKQVLSLWPNPATRLLQLNTSQNLFGKTFHIYDLKGQLILEDKFNSTKININRLATGTYLLSIPELGVSEKFIKE